MKGVQITLSYISKTSDPVNQLILEIKIIQGKLYGIGRTVCCASSALPAFFVLYSLAVLNSNGIVYTVFKACFTARTIIGDLHFNLIYGGEETSEVIIGKRIECRR